MEVRVKVPRNSDKVNPRNNECDLPHLGMLFMTEAQQFFSTHDFSEKRPGRSAWDGHKAGFDCA
jgi:hypothetical protein